MSNKTELDFTKPLEYVGCDCKAIPFSLVTSNGRGEHPVMGYIGAAVYLSLFTAAGRSSIKGSSGYLRNVKRKPREWYTWARDASALKEGIPIIGIDRCKSQDEIILGAQGGAFIVRVTEVLPEEE